MLSLIANYDSLSDAVNVVFYKHVGSTISAITSGIVTLKQNGDILRSATISSDSKQLTFHHPEYVTGLTVHASIDSEVKEVAVETEKVHTSPVAHTQPAPIPNMEYIKKETDINTSKSIDGPIILNLNFKDTTNLDVKYSGGNRYLFDYDNKIVNQPLNTLPVNASVFIESGTVNLLPKTDNKPDLLNLFTASHANRAGNFSIVNEFSVSNLRYNSLGGISGDDTTAQDLSLSLSPITNGKTFQALLGFTGDLISTSFSVVCELLDAANSVVTTKTTNYTIADFKNKMVLVNCTATDHASGVKLQAKIIVPKTYSGDRFYIDILLPQVTSNSFVSSYCDDVRTADVVVAPVTLDYDSCVIEMNISALSTACVLLECAPIKVVYSGTNLVFSIGNKEISYTVDLKAYSDYAFSYDKVANLMYILIDDVPVKSGGADFVITANSDLYIGCDKNGQNQMNGQINKIIIMR